ncbi:hypothetical protein [Leeia aquatica]|uniref:Uncharacterized protein n=1 Tax=Leeia aquatica TaxID=2725557 RepID=A0A847RW39_9NEIS|nr:hypothetical protein [Leeia aquatica]NLR74031.1 hypothetical protein [Leeia aquatica]
MRIAYFAPLALLLAAVAAPAHSATSCSSLRSRFLAQAHATHFRAWTQHRQCAAALPEDNAALQQLEMQTARGQTWAAHALARVLERLDGGNLEDGLLVLGQFADQRPTTLLHMAHDGELSLRNMKNALIMHPATLMDNLAAQLAGLQRRLQRIQQVKAPSLRLEQAEAVQALQHAIARIPAPQP